MRWSGHGYHAGAVATIPTPPQDIAKSLPDLEAENRRLKDQIARYDEHLLEQVKSAIADSVADLKSNNAAIADRLKAYGPVAEDVWGLRVFDKAKSYLIGWITAGGVVTLVAAIAAVAVGYQAALDFVARKVQGLSEAEIARVVQVQVEHQVDQYFKDHASDYANRVEELTVGFVRQQTAVLVARFGYSTEQPATVAVSTTVTSDTVSNVDYAPQMGPVRDTGQEAAVVGFAIAAAMEYQIFKQSGQHLTVSPREIYNLAKNSPDADSGATIQGGIRVVRTEGAVLEDVWPYRPGEFTARPPAGFATARRWRVGNASAVKGLPQIKAALRTNGPLVMGITVYESFSGPDVLKSGIVSMPKPKERIIGGHAICVVGYDDSRQLLKFVNSWGVGWGEEGYGYLPYDYLTDNLGEVWALQM